MWAPLLVTSGTKSDPNYGVTPCARCHDGSAETWTSIIIRFGYDYDAASSCGISYPKEADSCLSCVMCQVFYWGDA